MSRLKSVILFILLFSLPSVLYAQEKTQTDEQKAFAIAEKAFTEQLYDVSRTRLEEFLKTYPDTLQKDRARELLAKSYYHGREYTKSVDIIESLLNSIREADKQADLYYWLGRNLLKLKKYEEAGKAFDSSIATGSRGIPVTYARIDKAVVIFEMKRAEEAFQILDNIISMQGEQEPRRYAQLEKSRLYLSQGEYAKARDNLLLMMDMKMSKELQSRMFFLLGEAEYYLNNFDDAIVNYKKALGTGTYYEWYPEAAYAIGWCNLKTGELDKALNAFISLAEENKDNSIGQKSELSIARIYILKEKTDDAKKILSGILAKNTGEEHSAEAAYLLGDIAFAEKKYDDAIGIYDEFLKKYPESQFAGDAYFGKGSSLFIQGKYEESIIEFGKVIDSSNRKKLIQASLAGRGDVYYEMKQYAKAIDEYRKAVKETLLIEQPERVWMKLGWCYYKLEDYAEAVKAFETILQRYPASAITDEAMYRIGGCYYRQGEFEKAIEQYSKLREKYPKSSLLDKVAYQTGTCYYHLGNYYLARKEYKEVVDKYPQSVLADRAAYEIGWTYYYEPKKGDEALPYFESYIKERSKSPYAPEVLFWIGEYYYNKTEYDKAMAKFVELEEKYPESFLADEALYWSGRAAIMLKKPDTALGSFRKLIEGFPESEFLIDSQYQAAVCYLLIGKPDDALKLLSKLRSAPGGGYLKNDITLRTGESHLRMGNLKEAMNEYKSLIEQDERKYKAWGLYGNGLVLKAQKKYSEAIPVFMEVAWEYEEHTDVVSLSYLEAGDCYIHLGKKREAVDRCYRTIVESRLPDAEEAQRRIDELKRKSYIFD